MALHYGRCFDGGDTLLLMGGLCFCTIDSCEDHGSRHDANTYRVVCETSTTTISADEWGDGVRGYYIDTEDKVRSEPDQPGSVEACKALCITANGCKSINWAHVFGICWLIPLSRAEAEQMGKWKADPNVIHYDKIQPQISSTSSAVVTTSTIPTAECRYELWLEGQYCRNGHRLDYVDTVEECHSMALHYGRCFDG